MVVWGCRLPNDKGREGLVDLIDQLLQMDTAKRLTMGNVMAHKFFKQKPNMATPAE